MGEILRSKPMLLVQLYIQIEAAHDTIDELGKLGLVQFRDLNPDVNAFQRNFVNEVKRADEMERKLRYFEEELRKAGVWNLPERPPHVVYEEYVDSYEGQIPIAMDQLESQLEEIEKELIQLSGNQETLDRNYNELVEMKHVLEKDKKFFGSSEDDEMSSYSEHQPLVSTEESHGNSGLSFVTGVILRNKMATFERVLWRAMRGNLFVRQAEITEYIRDPSTGELEEKNVFIVLFRGENSEHKIRKLCEAFGANLYPCPHHAEERSNLLREIEQRLADLKQVLSRSAIHNDRVLGGIMNEIERWKMDVLKEKSIYHTMNLFNYDTGRRCLVAEGWCPEEQADLDRIRAALDRGHKRSNASVPSVLSVLDHKKAAPPTYFVTNRFTEAFQNLVESYGVARYREINPSVLTVVTFPFLFGVMFGDIGHGFILFLIGLFLVVKEKPLGRIKLPEMVDTLYDGRWLFLLMAICSMYCGSLYNEFFGIPMDLFGTNWAYDENIVKGTQSEYANWLNTGRPTDEYRCYPFGADPLWKGANNELDYYNSLKMKMSVLMGVVHMTVGIIISLFNQIHFREWLSVFYEFFPQMVFLLGLFGFMDALIVMKWLIDWTLPQYQSHGVDGFLAPRLLNLLIQMFLTPFKVLDQFYIFNGQLGIQLTLLGLIVCSVPMMLLGKPIARYIYEGRKHHYQVVLDDDEEAEEFVFSEEFVHQVIHTIEFVLGAVSNTASYLRLWALSLAHAELSEVFWDRVMVYCLEKDSVFFIFLGWSVWCALSVAVLLIMESLSAFLHALRLHWVEFQNKFYKADGHKFMPFSYQAVLALGDDALIVE
eukprot:CAMPEP_0117024578 /NCGR_PEP_ID=MMETSP0472-20121206/18235_1 /TAXON_ID=693140 ORGANISM="Tiarina fusus, Strain LIS" /NCGR_SAMPLE_ID=MMETSP0472 /ASSEMBLY_ACC=CAM_ASM_000603 /LENGTH=823 /DNA_ID=CAMNT_0004731041 /DNA_START=18 /DNA_END=2489 /DNA_ORIENTATION=+